MDDRAVSTSVSYVLVLGIVGLLTSGLVVGFAPVVIDQQQDTTRSTMAVFGNDIAGSIDSADRLATKAGDSGTVELSVGLPDRVGGSSYEIELVNKTGENGYAGYHYDIELRSADPDTTVRVRVRSRHPVEVESGVLDGGNLKITIDHEGSRSKLVIRNV